jgi:hypothetical protein
MGTLVELLLDDKNIAKLEEVHGGINAAARIGAGLANAGLKKQPHLKPV